MKKVFVKGGIVIGHASVFSLNAVAVSTDPDSVEHDVADDSPVDLGWTCAIVDDLPVFTAPAALLPMLTPMTLYMAFTPAERIAIKTSTDPMVKEFWATYQLSVQLQKPTDPNLTSVKGGLAYLAAPNIGILASPARVDQILAGVPQ